jgi:ParB-like chromosome segregation protein Spo0J
MNGLNQDKLPDVMKVHPHCMLFSQKAALSQKELDDLREDIKADGVKVPILVNAAKDTILDGRTRWMLANDVGRQAEVPYEVFEGSEDEIRREILSRNVYRRHMTPDQRVAIIGILLGPQLKADARERQLSALHKGDKPPVALKSAQRGKEGSERAAEQLSVKAKVGRDKGRKVLRMLDTDPEALEDVAAGEKRLADVKPKPRKPRKTKPTPKKTLEHETSAKWVGFIQKFDLDQNREVKRVIHSFIPVMSKDWPWAHNEEEAKIISKFIVLTLRNWPCGERAKEALELIRGCAEPSKKGGK